MPGLHRIRKVAGAAATGTVSTIAGTGTAGFAQLSLPGATLLQLPITLLVDPHNGDVYFSENGNNAVRVLIGP